MFRLLPLGVLFVIFVHLIAYLFTSGRSVSIVTYDAERKIQQGPNRLVTKHTHTHTYPHLFHPECCKSHLSKLIGILSEPPNITHHTASLSLFLLQDFHLFPGRQIPCFFTNPLI
jgi:hypothetical protein